MTAPPAARVCLAIEPQLCGELSLGTVAVIRVLQRHLELSLEAAAEAVNRAVWDGATVELPVSSPATATALIEALAALPRVPRVRAWLAARA